ncbi:MAG: hypothetical protein ACOH5I_10705 [Oligoflexus sp.]
MSDQSEESYELAIDPELFTRAVLLFPCFHEADPKMASDELFHLITNAYRDDQLTEEQDLVIELVLHLHDESSPFNLRRAREIWSPEDMQILVTMLTAERPSIGSELS